MALAVRIVQGTLGSVALFELDKSLGVHAHSKWHILIKCGGADAAYRIRDRCWPLTDDKAILVNTWEPHKYVHPTGAPSSTILALYVEPRWLSEYDRSFGGLAPASLFPDPCVDVTPAMHRAASELVDCLTRAEAIEEAVLERLTFDLFEAAPSEWSDVPVVGTPLPNQSAYDFRIRKAVRYIDERTNEPLNISALARHSGLSRPHLFTLFRRCTNLSPGLYANMLRMNSAVSRISASVDTMSDISGDLGFSAQSHFTRFFRGQWGFPPSEYRRVIQYLGADRH